MTTLCHDGYCTACPNEALRVEVAHLTRVNEALGSTNELLLADVREVKRVNAELVAGYEQCVNDLRFIGSGLGSLSSAATTAGMRLWRSHDGMQTNDH